jgi:exonuclease VII small subunit
MAKEKFSYDKAIEEVEEIVTRMENASADYKFDDLRKDVVRAKELLVKCKKSIAEQEDDMKELLQEL